MIEIEWLVWDEWNLSHIWERHAMRPETVEAVCYGDPVELRGYKGRIILIGPAIGEQMFTVVVGPVPGQPGAYYTFSARPASRKERRYYFDEKGRASHDHE
jgi:hypothetical protein